jgi:predicted transcriptional regulator
MSRRKELAESKLILLYLINKIDLPVSEHHIARIILENNYMNYFILQQYLNELCNGNLLKSEVEEGKTLYSITPYGKQTLSYFHTIIPAGIKSNVNNIVSTLKKKIKNETRVIADYSPGYSNDYMVTCKVTENNFPLIELHLSVGTQEDAKTIVTNWNEHSYLIYPEIIQSLLKKRT